MARKTWLVLLLSGLAVWLNLHPPQLFFDQQLMLGASLAVLALLLWGWTGLVVGVAAYAVTWHTWGHPFALLNGCCWLLVVQLMLSRGNGGVVQRGSGHVVLITLGYWLLIGVPAEWLWFRFGMGIAPSAALSLGFKELVTALLTSTLALLAFLVWQGLSPAGRRRGLPLRGLTFATLLVAITLPGLLITFVLSYQHTAQALAVHRDKLQSFGVTSALLGRLGAVPPRLGGVAVLVQQGSQQQLNTDPALFARLAADHQSDLRALPLPPELTLLVPRQSLPALQANHESYLRVETRWGDRRITVVQPAAGLIHALAYDLLLPVLAVLALLFVAGVLLSALISARVTDEFRQLRTVGPDALDLSVRRQRQPSLIREFNQLAQAIRRTTLALARSNRRHRNFFNMPRVGTAITSPSKGWVEVNDVTCELLGYSREELFQRSWADLTHPDDLAADEAQFERMLRREIDGYQLEKRFVRRDGAIVHVLLAGGCGAIGDRPVDLCYVSLIDITDRKRVEAQLASAEERHRLQLEQKLKTSLTAAAVVHEIQQPLASMLLNCRLAMQSLDPLEADALPAGLQKRLCELTAAGDQVVTTMERMRMLLRNVETEHTTIDLAAGLHSALVFMRSDLAEAQVQLSREGLDEACFLQGDSAQLQIAVVNLLRNAIQALLPMPAANRRVLVQMRCSQEQVAIAVSDSGPGFAADDSGGASWELLKSTKAAGMGIGLFLAQTAAANHGGRLRIGRSSRLGGAEAVIELPR
jgi:PAS domain S-box-containing protein